MREGIVTLTGTLDPKTGPHGDLIPVAIQLMWGVDGVVDIIDHLGVEQLSRAPRHRLVSKSRDSRASPSSDQPGSPLVRGLW